MQNTNLHVLDEELVRLADGELGPLRQTRVEKHLAACWACRARRAQLEDTVADFVRTSKPRFDSRIPPADGPRTLLKLRLAEAAKVRPGYLKRLKFAFPGWRIACAGGAVLVILLAGMGWWHDRPKVTSTQTANKRIVFEPNPMLTPGAVRPVSFTQICAAGRSDKNRAVAVAVQRQVFQEYGIPNARPEDYEVDYLITPELGGTDDIKNLWPQSLGAKDWSAHTKDYLEDRLHELVCTRKIELSAAQRDIASDWISAYKKYVEAGKPRAEGWGILNRNEIAEMAGLSPVKQDQ